MLKEEKRNEIFNSLCRFTSLSVLSERHQMFSIYKLRPKAYSLHEDHVLVFVFLFIINKDLGLVGHL